MKNRTPALLFILTAATVGLLGVASMSLAAIFLLLMVIPAVFWLGSAMIRPSMSGVTAVARVLVVLALVTLVFAQVYLLLPSDSFSPQLQRNWSGVAESLYLSTITAATLGGTSHEAATGLGKLAQTIQIMFSLVTLGFGLNYVIDTHLK